MFKHQNFIISSGDYVILQNLDVPQCKDRDLLVEMLRRKLDQAIVTFPSDIGPDIVGIGSRVQYRVNGLRAEHRTLLVQQQQRDAGVLALLSVQGLALLGLGVGHSAVVRSDEDAQELLAVEAVSRPDARGTGQFGVLQAVATAAAERGDPRVLRFQPKVAAPPRTLAFTGDEDDPGPSAA